MKTFLTDFPCSVVTALIVHSQWFEVTPLPDEEWEIRVKDDAARFVLEEDPNATPIHMEKP